MVGAVLLQCSIYSLITLIISSWFSFNCAFSSFFFLIVTDKRNHFHANKIFFSFFSCILFFLFIFLCLWNLFFNFSSVVTCLVSISENKCELYLWKELHEIKFYIIIQNFLLPVSSVISITNVYEHKFSERKTQNRSSNLIDSSTNVIFSK